MSYAETLDKLVQEAEDAIEALYLAWLAGEVSDGMVTALATATIVRSASKASSFAAVALSANLTTLTGSAVAPVPAPLPQGYVFQVQTSVQSFIPTRDGRGWVETTQSVAREEVLRTATEARGKGLAKAPVDGWTRQLSPAACPACRKWHGPTLPRTARMARHKGCSCVQVPVITNPKENTSVR